MIHMDGLEQIFFLKLSKKFFVPFGFFPGSNVIIFKKTTFKSTKVKKTRLTTCEFPSNKVSWHFI